LFDAVLVHCVHERATLAASVCDATEIPKEPECHCVCGEVAAREAEASDSVPDDRRLLRRVISDAAVLHERNFAAVADIVEPLPSVIVSSFGIP
jgi:hypothetical protein